MSNVALFAIVVLLLPVLVVFAEKLFPYFLLAPFYSLPLLVLLKTQDIGTFAIGFQILAIVCGLISVFKSFNYKSLNAGVSGTALLSVACIYGMIIPQTNSTPLIVKVIAIKVILLPVVFSAMISGIDQVGYVCRIVKIFFWVCIANSLAGVLQLYLGTEKLIALGLPYGTQIREFTSGRVRALGLSLSNFEFALFSGLAAIICYAVLTNLILENQISKKLAFVTLFSSMISMYTSITRQGILFPLVAIAFLELVRKKNALRIFTQIYSGLILILVLLALNNLFLRSNTFYGRIALWRSLLREFGNFIGNGLAFCGGATTSSYAKNISQIFVDNYFISIYLQLGIVGLLLYLITIYAYLANSNPLGTAIVVALITTSLVTEFWEYTSVASLTLMFVVTLGSKITNRPKFRSPYKGVRA